jgi:hypothetical protein
MVDPDDALTAALRGENPKVMVRMPSAFAVIGDTQHLPGYSVLLCEDESANHLSDLDCRSIEGAESVGHSS